VVRGASMACERSYHSRGLLWYDARSNDSKWLCCIVILLLTLLTILPFNGVSSTSLTILHSGNVHGNIWPLSRASHFECSIDEANLIKPLSLSSFNDTCIGGAARRLAYFDEVFIDMRESSCRCDMGYEPWSC
jgi:hypothetical protein